MLVCKIEIVLKELAVPGLSDPHCNFSVGQEVKSQPFSAVPVVFDRVSSKDFLVLKVLDDQKEVAIGEILLQEFLKSGKKIIEGVYILRGFEDKEEKGSVKIAIARQEDQCYRVEKVVSGSLGQLDELKTDTNLQQGGYWNLNQNLMVQEIESLRNQIIESYDARKELQDSINQTSNQFQLFHLDSLSKIENSTKDLKEATEKIIEQQITNQKLITKEIQNEQKLVKMAAQIELLKSKITLLESQTQTTQSLRQNLQEAQKIKQKLTNDYLSSKEQFEATSKILQSHLEKVNNQKSDLQNKLESLKLKLQKTKKENYQLNQTLLKLKIELVQQTSNTNLIDTFIKKEKQQTDLIQSLYQTKQNLQSQLKELRSVTQQKLKFLQQNNQNLLTQKVKADQAFSNLKRELHQKQYQLKKISISLFEKEVSLISLEQHLCVQQDLNQIFDQLRSQNDAHITQKSLLGEENQILSSKIIQLEKLLKAVSVQKVELETAKLKSESDNELLKQYITDMKKRKIYIPIKDDPVDIALADFVNTKSLPIGMKFKREDSGVYYFGTKRIFVKLEQGKVIIRVGGGFMQIQDFLLLYSSVQLEKFQNRQRDQAQKTRYDLYGKYASSLITECVSPNWKSTGKLKKNQFSPYYGIQKRQKNSPIRSTPSPNLPRRGKRANNIN